MIAIVEEASTPVTLLRYASIPIAFLVESRYRVEPIRNGLGGWLLHEEPVAQPYVKDYDERDGEGPRRWAERFDLARWGILSAFDGHERIGGAAIALDTPEGSALHGFTGLAVLWDIRIHPGYRRAGVGSLLFPRIVDWAAARRCTRLLIETQNINVPACKYYARMDCELRAVHPDAYPDMPDEVQLLWYRRIARTT